MNADHLLGLLIGIALSLSAVSFFIWAWLGGLFKDPEEAKLRAFEAELKGEEESRDDGRAPRCD